MSQNFNAIGDHMSAKPTFRYLFLLVMMTVLVLSSCAPLTQPSVTVPIVPPTTLPTPTVEVDEPNIFADPAFFLPALLQALASHDTSNLSQWMTDPFLTGTWRIGKQEISPINALDMLYTDQLGAQSNLQVLKDVDLKTLLGGVDPLSIPGSESGVMFAYLVSGWGKDGSDEAILFITMEPADNLKWHGWMQVRGGFSGDRIGGIQAFTSNDHGFSVFLPKDYEVSNPNESEVMFLAPGEGHPSDDRAAAFVFVEPADGRTAEQVATEIAQDNKSVMGAGYTGGNITVLEIDGEAAYSVNELTGQDMNRRVYIVHNDQLYWLLFIPDNKQAAAYLQMEDLYAMVINTFNFTR
jgi:hypothetical protein